VTDAPHNRTPPTDPVADDIAERNPDTGDVVAGEQVLDEGQVAPEPDELTNGETREDRLHAADERTDPGAPPAQEEPG
jgi:hypothetical protein